ncbi:MAG: hypothetical protein HY903_06740 [Deltaproteobacteria bacterium]|nr:hypothetical protein [Deltaproteobacteria bacterium]
MRSTLFALLVAVPTALVTFLVARGTGPCRVDPCSPLGATTPPTAGAGRAEGTPGATPAANAAKDPDAALKALLAPPLAGFTLKAEAALYDQKGLFDYIDGAAPVFIERGFRKLAALELKTTAGGELAADVYDMGITENALAIFTFEKPPAAQVLALGDAGHQGRLAVVFYRGRYYVKLTAFDAGAEAALVDLGRLLASRMP